MGTDEAMESELGLGELAGLTVANEADSLAYDVSNSRQNADFSFMDLLQTWLGGRFQTKIWMYLRSRRINSNLFSYCATY